MKPSGQIHDASSGPVPAPVPDLALAASSELSAASPSYGRSHFALALLAVVALMLFSAFVGLGTWQLHRLAWKQDLIARVTERAHAPPADIPTAAEWPKVTAAADEYRHVRLHGHWLPQHSRRVRASTLLGRGFWLMTPLQIDADHQVWVNRGFVTDLARIDSAAHEETAEVTGLLRISEPGGTLLQSNRPERDAWYSRDVTAMSRSAGLQQAAPFFIDADAGPQALPAGCTEGQCGAHPVAGLTVLVFPNNHLVYMMTWYGLALLVIVAAAIVARSEYRLRHRGATPP